MKEEFVWLDRAKILGIFLVIFGHLVDKMPESHFLTMGKDVIFQFHMPLFFVLSGFLYSNPLDKRQFVKKTLITIGLPYLIYQILYFPIAFFHYSHEGSESIQLVFFKCLLGILMGDGKDTLISHPVFNPGWFLMVIIQLRMFFCYFSITFKRCILLIPLCILFLHIQNVAGFDLPFCIDSAMMAIPFFLMGYLLRAAKVQECIKLYLNKAMGGFISLLVFLMVLTCYLIYKYNGVTEMNAPLLGRNILLTFLSGAIGSVSVILISMLPVIKITQNSTLIARNTLFIIFFHWIVIVFGGKLHLWSLLPCYGLLELIWAILYSCGILIASLPVVKYLLKKCPVVLGKGKVN